jgi:FAD/FMN-containing dehydrogenase
MEKRPVRAAAGLRRIDARLVEKFTASLKGHAILPDDQPYPRARRVWNHAVNLYPEIIVQCADVDDVMRAMEFSRRHDLATAIRSGGHSFAGHGVCDGGLVIDLSTMKRVEIDPGHLVARIEPGCVPAN